MIPTSPLHQISDPKPRIAMFRKLIRNFGTFGVPTVFKPIRRITDMDFGRNQIAESLDNLREMVFISTSGLYCKKYLIFAVSGADR